MPKLAMTDAAVKRLKAPATGQVDYFNSGYPGLALRVSCGGRKTWSFCYRFDGKPRRMSLDVYPVMTVAEAHDAWRNARDGVRAGQDPAKPRALEPATDFGSHLRGVDAARSGAAPLRTRHPQAHRARGRFLYGRTGRSPTWRSAIFSTRSTALLIEATTPRRCRLHAHLHRLFQWCLGRGIVQANPVAALPKPGEKRDATACLNDAELIAVWKAAEKIGYPYGPACSFSS